MSPSLQFPLEPIVSDADLPVIDLSKFPQELDDEELSHLGDHPMLAKIREACIEWGFFRLVNHGISVELLDKAQNVSRGLLSMPIEAKERAMTTCNPYDSYHRKDNFETFSLLYSCKSESLEQMCLKLWPEGNPSFCETMVTYDLCASNLAQKISKIIVASLGLDAVALYRSHFEKCISRLRLNGYSSHQKSIGEEILESNADPGCLTILYQDDGGGLEIRSREGKWFHVKPVSHSFVVNLGDSLKAWTNGRYRSAEHRVVWKGWMDRMSIAFFTSFPMETEIWAPEELVDNNNPRRYKPFLLSQLLHEVAHGQEDREKATALERIFVKSTRY
ncbi:hypothetical protein SUGI_0852440 [Cryptomeria japonica]|uniref:2-oxoglutarate-dependent dioxygenase DAO-like n=1 Tax=Cryptomeria japonica TaxID=3369 RepID=UPI002414C43E|nr:2-oxoglutarate-dependent dioxygenase DAO-like [Cryptomeria japonica]GLJ41171.1 hypothetical protein SUGI_0852440 [Cryptomeria japonica]